MDPAGYQRRCSAKPTRTVIQWTLHKLMDDEFGWHNSWGLEVYYPVYRLTWDRERSPRFLGSSHLKLDSTMYQARVYEPGTNRCPPSLPSGSNVAMIVSRPIHCRLGDHPREASLQTCERGI